MRHPLALSILFVVVAYVVNITFFPDAKLWDDVAVVTATRSDACSMSQDFVRQNLKAPSTAEFPLWTEANCQAARDGDVWKVRSYVDSQNGFGAMIRSDYNVEMRHHPDNDSWTLLNIAITP